MNYFLIITIVALMAYPHFRRHWFPFEGFLILLGFLSSELIIVLGFDTHVRAANFQFFCYQILLPILIFLTAYTLPIARLSQKRFACLYSAIGLPLISLVVIAVGLYYLISLDERIYWSVAIMAAIILLPSMCVRDRALMHVEDLFTSLFAVVLFSAMFTQSATQAGSMLAWLVFGGLAVGYLIARLTGLAINRINTPKIQALLVCLSAYLAYSLAGSVAVFICGLYFSHFCALEKNYSNQIWQLFGFISRLVMFLLVGIVTQVNMFKEAWHFMVAGVVVIMLSRLIGIVFFRENIKTRQERFLISLRGPLTLILAFALPQSMDHRWTIQSIAFGAVWFSLIIQWPLVNKLLGTHKST